MINKSIIFSIKRCNSSDPIFGHECETDEIIDEFIKGITVDFWNVHLTLDNTRYGTKPVYYNYAILG